MTPSFADRAVEEAWTRVWTKSLALMEAVQSLDESQLALAPPKGFNSIETIRHLRMTDGFEVDLIRKTPIGYARKPRMNLLGRMVISTMKKAKPMPTMAAMTPASAPCSRREAALACEEWKASLREIESLTSSKSASQTALKHPLFGPMGPLDLYGLMEAHLDYHILRLKQGGAPL